MMTEVGQLRAEIERLRAEMDALDWLKSKYDAAVEKDITEARAAAAREMREAVFAAVAKVRDGEIVKGKRPADAWINACNDIADAVHRIPLPGDSHAE